MLRTLRIRNLVIIDDLTVDFGPGLNLLTGETGAGKSILVDALGLVGGARAEKSMVRTGEDRALVEALFEIDVDDDLRRWFDEVGIDDIDEGQIVVRRQVSVSGSGRVQINGSPCTLAVLREVGERLLELHGQHEQRNLLDPGRQLELLDRSAGHDALLSKVSAAAEAVRDAQARRDELHARAGERSNRIEQLEQTVREIDALEPRAGELERLEVERRRLQSAEQMVALLEDVVRLTYDGEPAAAAMAATAAGKAEELAEIDPDLAEAAGRLRAASLELQDAAEAIRSYRDGAEFDPGRLEELKTRRSELERACLKYGVDEPGLVDLRMSCATELATLQNLDEELAAADEKVAAAEGAYCAAAEKLGRSRKKAGKTLIEAVQSQLAALALPKAKFDMELVPARGPEIERAGKDPVPLTSEGTERPEFLLAANPGEPMRPVRQAASGGELSRVMLAMHVVAEDASSRRAIVFDEVDTGVGGAVADAVGARLKRLAAHHQVLCITHLPQVAAHADAHFRVKKRVAAGRTHAGIVSLSGTERVEELARMLGGSKPTPTSRRHASEMLTAAGRRSRPGPRTGV
jgi:DNA repair protein RecN (Recombination protein N)